MKFTVAMLFLILSLPVFGQEGTMAGQPVAKLEYYLQRYAQTGSDTYSTREVLSFVDKLSAKRQSTKRDKEFLAYLFYKVHHRYLKNFAELPTFADMLQTGTYNCLTATALYALLLDYYDFPYKVIETNYHIFLVAKSDQGDILFEATDPTTGFVMGTEAIQRHIDQYTQDSSQPSGTSQGHYQFGFDLYNTVNLDQILGLMHYNLSIAAYNDHQLVTATIELSKAIEVYQSPRIEEFSQVVLQTVQGSGLDPNTKQKCLQRLYAVCEQANATASLN